MDSQKDRINDILKVLVGLPLSDSFRAAGMRILHFGKVRVVEGGRFGDYALHLQCPWRVVGPDGVITGMDDLWEPVNEDDWDENWNYEDSDTLLDARLNELLRGTGLGTKSSRSETIRLIVEAVEATGIGDLRISLTEGYKIEVFVCGGRAEDWRFFKPGSDDGHLVFEGGKMAIEAAYVLH